MCLGTNQRSIVMTKLIRLPRTTPILLGAVTMITSVALARPALAVPSSDACAGAIHAIFALPFSVAP
jgi:hypothetical protein